MKRFDLNQYVGHATVCEGRKMENVERKKIIRNVTKDCLTDRGN